MIEKISIERRRVSNNLARRPLAHGSGEPEPTRYLLLVQYEYLRCLLEAQSRQSWRHRNLKVRAENRHSNANARATQALLHRAMVQLGYQRAASSPAWPSLRIAVVGQRIFFTCTFRCSARGALPNRYICGCPCSPSGQSVLRYRR